MLIPGERLNFLWKKLIQNNCFNLPKIIGHRGVKNLFPENTIQSISAAFNLGLDWVEVDVKISKDKIPFLLHDDTLNRTTSGKGLANLLNYSDIKNLDAGYFFYNKKTDIYPPNLREVLELLKIKKKSINIELKPNINLEVQNVREILKITNQFREIQIYYSSFDLKSCIELVNLNPYSYCGLLIDSFDDYSIQDIIDLSNKYISVRVLSSNDKDQRATPMQFLEENSAKIIINGGYFNSDKEPTEHVGLLKTKGNLEEPASHSVYRDSERYHISRGAFGVIEIITK